MRWIVQTGRSCAALALIFASGAPVAANDGGWGLVVDPKGKQALVIMRRQGVLNVRYCQGVEDDIKIIDPETTLVALAKCNYVNEVGIDLSKVQANIGDVKKLRLQRANEFVADTSKMLGEKDTKSWDWYIKFTKDEVEVLDARSIFQHYDNYVSKSYTVLTNRELVNQGSELQLIGRAAPSKRKNSR